ncbi:hypothetical protein R1flu_025944 [Riccia fluitans]|uniref:Transposase n=1 Tax=Riccia fluitans TaxID=41844 RepID=A0ABD1XZ68_9MARC
MGQTGPLITLVAQTDGPDLAGIQRRVPANGNWSDGHMRVPFARRRIFHVPCFLAMGNGRSVDGRTNQVLDGMDTWRDLESPTAVTTWPRRIRLGKLHLLANEVHQLPRICAFAVHPTRVVDSRSSMSDGGGPLQAIIVVCFSSSRLKPLIAESAPLLDGSGEFATRGST